MKRETYPKEFVEWMFQELRNSHGVHRTLKALWARWNRIKKLQKELQ